MRISDWSSDVCSSDLRGLHQHLPGVLLHRVLFGNADDGQRQRLDAAHAAVAFAARADDLAGLAQARAQALGRELEPAEPRTPAQLHAASDEPARTLQTDLHHQSQLVAQTYFTNYQQ